MKPKNQAMNLLNLMQEFDTAEECRTYLQELRWPKGVKCPRCQSEKISRIRHRNQFDCDSCRYQFSVTAGSIFHDSHLPLPKWFAAVYLMCEAKKAVSANQLKRTLGVSYKTAWYLCHRVRKAVEEAKVKPQLKDVVQVDGTLHTNSVENPWSLLKRSIVGSYHQISTKHVDKYLDEFEWRFNGRENPYLFRDTLLKLLNAEPLPYEKLIA